MIQLREATRDDIAFICQAEQQEDTQKFIISWPQEKHILALVDDDLLHLMIELDKEAVGFVILAGLQNENESVEFRRIVVVKKRQGYGQAAIRLVQDYVFGQCHAHRLWLDVKEANTRAQSIYKKLGFVVEGTLRDCLKTGHLYESLIVMSMLYDEYIAQ